MNTAAMVHTDFALRLYHELARAQPDKNLFLSPFSVRMVLAMCAVGAKGQTRKALSDLIGAPANVEEQYRKLAESIRSAKDKTEPSVEFVTASALWGQQGCRFRPDYKKAIAAFCDGTLSEVNFHTMPDDAVKAINAWVEGKTAGKIKELITRDLITADTRLVLTNAIYFKGKWDSEFDKEATWDEDWHGLGGSHQVPMMHQRRSYLYFENAEFQALDLPYKGERLSMLVVLPRTKTGLTALENKWTAGNTYQQVTDSLRSEKTVVVSLPRFKMETALNPKPALCAVGAELIFTDQADFGGIADEPLKISEVIHKAFVEVNEEGTEAAAATGAVMMKTGLAPEQPKIFQADHPFLFVIRDRTTNAVLFSGRVLDVQHGRS